MTKSFLEVHVVDHEKNKIVPTYAERKAPDPLIHASSLRKSFYLLNKMFNGTFGCRRKLKTTFLKRLLLHVHSKWRLRHEKKDIISYVDNESSNLHAHARCIIFKFHCQLIRLWHACLHDNEQCISQIRLLWCIGWSGGTLSAYGKRMWFTIQLRFLY